MSLFDVAKALQELLDDPQRWTRGHARTKNPDGTVSFCLMGAVREVTSKAATYDWRTLSHKGLMQMVCMAVEELFPDLHSWTLPRVNDSFASHEDIRAICERVVKIAESTEKPLDSTYVVS